jgi:hypothetical protein
MPWSKVYEPMDLGPSQTLLERDVHIETRTLRSLAFIPGACCVYTPLAQATLWDMITNFKIDVAVQITLMRDFFEECHVRSRTYYSLRRGKMPPRSRNDEIKNWRIS